MLGKKLKISAKKLRISEHWKKCEKTECRSVSNTICVVEGGADVSTGGKKTAREEKCLQHETRSEEGFNMSPPEQSEHSGEFFSDPRDAGEPAAPPTDRICWRR